MVRKSGAFGIRGRLAGAGLAAVIALGIALPAGAQARVSKPKPSDTPAPAGPTVLGTAVTDPSTCGTIVSKQRYDASADAYSLYSEVRDMGVDAYYNAHKFGQGIDIAMIDTGVAPVAGLTDNVIDGPDLSFESQAQFGPHANPDLVHNDTFGHGTHMASIMVGADGDPDAVNPRTRNPNWQDPSLFFGIAPKARLVSLKVAGSAGAADVTQVIAAIDWVVQHRHDHGLNIRVLNLSYGLQPAQSTNALTFAVEQAWAAGIVVVTAAGNDGHGGNAPGHAGSVPGLLSPAIDPDVLAVGSYDNGGTVGNRSDDDTSEYSSKGQHRDPDFMAPGEHVIGLRVPGATADDMVVDDCTKNASPNRPWYTPVFGPGGRFLRGSGTSQAAAMASGVVALMLSQDSHLTPEQVRGILRSTARAINVNDTGRVQGRGELDAASVFNAVVNRQYGVPRRVSYSSGITGLITDARPANDSTLLCTNMLSAQIHAECDFMTDQAWKAPPKDYYSTLSALVNVDLHGKPFDPKTHSAQSAIDPKTNNYACAATPAPKPLSSVRNASICLGPWTPAPDGGEMWNGTEWSGGGFTMSTNPLFARLQWDTVAWSGASWLGDSWGNFNWTTSHFRSGGWEISHLRNYDWMISHLRTESWQSEFWRDNVWA